MEGETITADIVAPVAPSLDSLISGVLSDDIHAGGNDALDNLTIRISGPKIDGSRVSDNGTAAQSSDGQPRKRGRPAGGGVRQSDSGKPSRKSKAEIETELARVTAELATERARSDSAAVSELAQQVEMMCFLAFGAIAQKRGAHWGMSKEEAKNIGSTGALALAPHAEHIRKYSPWSMFAACVGGAVYSRIQEDKRLIELHGLATPEAL